MLTNSGLSWLSSQTQHQQRPSLILGKKMEPVPKVTTLAHFPTIHLFLFFIYFIILIFLVYPLNPILNTIYLGPSDSEVGSGPTVKLTFL